MRIYKHIQSCLIVENKGKTMLFDPGKYGFAISPLDIKSLHTLDYILITHQHSDHMHPLFIKLLLAEFPHAKIVSNHLVKEKLKPEGFSVELQGNEDIKLTTLLHESSFNKESVANTIFTVFNSFIHSGDNIEYLEGAEIMTLPIDCGMWGNVSKAVERLAELKPKYIVPVHDYRLKDEIRDEVYVRMTDYFESQGITFFSLKPGEEKIFKEY